MITPSSQEPGRVSGFTQTTTGTAVWKAAGDYTGDQTILITVQIDDVSGGQAIGEATFRWKTSLTVSGWEATGVATDTSYTTLQDGVQVAWEGTGDVFELDDLGVFWAYPNFGPGNLFDRDRDKYFQSEDLSTDLITNGGFDSDTTGWTETGCTLASVAGGQAGNCLQVTYDSGASQSAHQDLTTVAGNAYKVSCYIKSGTSGAEEAQLQAYDTGTTTVIDTEAATTSGTWAQISLRFVAVGTTTRILLIKNSATAGTMLFDTVEGFCGLTLDVDLGSAQQVTAFILGDHNLTADAQVYYEDDSAADWADPDYSHEFTTVIDPLSLYFDQTYRYHRVTIFDETNSDGYIRIGKLYIGVYVQLTAKTAWGSNKTIQRNLITNKSAAGIQRSYCYSTGEVFDLVFNVMTPTDVDNLYLLWLSTFSTATGAVIPLWVHYFYDESDTLKYCYWMNDFQKEFRSYLLYKMVPMHFEEVIKTV